jgi:rubrerythrin
VETEAGVPDVPITEQVHRHEGHVIPPIIKHDPPIPSSESSQWSSIIGRGEVRSSANEPPYIERPTANEHRPPTMEHRPPVIKDRPIVNEHRPPVNEHKPPIIPHKPPLVEHIVPVIEPRPPVNEHGHGVHTPCPELPYPVINVTEKNPRYAEILQELYSGNASELTAVLQYTYQNAMIDGASSEIAETLYQISLDELRHIRILGRIIKALGSDPRYIKTENKRREYYVADNKAISYSKTIPIVLMDDIAAEKGAIAAYKAAAEKIRDANIVAILRRIAMDHEGHLERYTALYRKYV